MELNNENYFSKEANIEYMSVSQYKNFLECPTMALALVNEQYIPETKESYLEGKLFENIVTGNEILFMSKHPEMTSSKGATAGQLKSNFKSVKNAADKFMEQKLFMDIINKCDKQVILTGVINGVKIRGELDLLDKETLNIYDIKCMSNFEDVWSKKDKAYIPWYYNYNYVLQLAVYQELVKQNFGKCGETFLIAATKEKIPDVCGLEISQESLNMVLDEFKFYAPMFDEIKKGERKPISCNCCDYCKTIKTIDRFEEVK